MSDKLMQTYVWHKGKCFFVSTINRDSSSFECGEYAETMVWEWNDKTAERGELIFQAEAPLGSVYKHNLICQCLFDDGVCEDQQEAEDN